MPRKKKPDGKKPDKGKKKGAVKKPPAIKRKDHAQGAPDVIGSEERMSEAILFAWSMRRRGYTYETIAKMCMHPPLNLEREPTIQCVGKWILRGREIVNEMLKEEVEAEREVMKAWVGQLVEKFLIIATEDGIMVNRKQMIDGEWTTILDENAFDEQQKAGRVALKAIAQLASLMGFDVPKKTDGASYTNFQLQIINHINGTMKQTNGKTIEVDSTGETLELTTGIDGL